jgi:hypothetical protein
MAQPSPVRFGVIGVNHAHIYGQVDLLVRARATPREPAEPAKLVLPPCAMMKG